MKLTAPLLFAGALLAGCGGGNVSTEPTLFFGASNGGPSANGLAFADGSQGFEDTAGQTLKIKVARYLTDYETGETRLVISDETVSFDVDDNGNAEDMTITIGDETLVFVEETATDSNGRGWSSYLNNSSDVSATGGVYSYSYGGNEDEPGALDTEAFFAFGFETDPATIANLMSTASYSGGWDGYGVLLDETGAILQSEVNGSGDITLNADFAAGTVGGSITGAYFGDDNDFDIDGTLATSTISGNGFLSNVSLDACGGGFTCSSDSQAAGVFFGDEAQEISGIIGFDATRIDDADGTGQRLISGAGFTADQ